MFERPEGQKLYGLNYMEMWGRIKALEDREQALEATLERQQLSYEREREIDQEEIERLLAQRRGDPKTGRRWRATPSGWRSALNVPEPANVIYGAKLRP